MAIVFFGTPSFAVPSLKMLYDNNIEIASVITQPDRVGGRGHRNIPPPVKVEAERLGLRVLQPVSVRTEEFILYVKSLMPEFLVVVAYGRILPKALLDIPEGGALNLHASLLPKYRGAAPVQWSIINGEKTTGVTAMLMDEGLDTGDILLQQEVVINEEDNGLSLSERLSTIGASLLLETLKGLRKGSIKPHPQEGKPSYAPSLKKEDGLIDWSMPAEAIFNRVRGLYPWPCAYTFLGCKMIKLLRVEVLAGEGAPGVVIRRDKKTLIVGTSSLLISLLEVQMEGRRAVDVAGFLQGQGREIKVGDRLGE